MLRITLDLKDKEKLAALADLLERNTDDLLNDLANQSLELMQNQIPVRTGRLKASTRITDRSKYSFKLTVGDNTATYAKVVAFGCRKPHLIVAKRSPHKRLKLPPKFPHSVMHPGNKPNPYWARGIRLIRSYVKKRISLFFRDFIGGR